MLILTTLFLVLLYHHLNLPWYFGVLSYASFSVYVVTQIAVQVFKDSK